MIYATSYLDAYHASVYRLQCYGISQKRRKNVKATALFTAVSYTCLRFMPTLHFSGLRKKPSLVGSYVDAVAFGQLRSLCMEEDTYRLSRVFEHKAVAAEYRGDESEQL